FYSRKCKQMIDLLKYENLLDEQVSVACTDGQIVEGAWIDWLAAEDASEDARQEDSILVQAKSGAITEVYLSEIIEIQQTTKRPQRRFWHRRTACRI
ncbi:MAG: hypothetical protein RR954_08860, partial [Christensenellaceae bacterium]